MRAQKVCLETIGRYEDNNNTEEATKLSLQNMVRQVREVTWGAIKLSLQNMVLQVNEATEEATKLPSKHGSPGKGSNRRGN